MGKGKYLYFYGAFYDINRPESMDSSDTMVVYSGVRGVERAIGSLEGIFFSVSPLSGDTLCLRKDKKKFEEIYKGKFVGFPLSGEAICVERILEGVIDGE